jgi:hypothetical protein
MTWTSISLGHPSHLSITLAVKIYQLATFAASGIHHGGGDRGPDIAVTVAAGVPTYADGLLGLWNFNDLAPGTTLTSSSPGSTTVITRGTVPCALPDAGGGTSSCPPAVITGSGAASVPGLVAGKYGQGLNIANGTQNWGMCSLQPSTGPAAQ